MLVKSFLAWMDTAPVRERAEAVTMLARAYLTGALGGESPEAVEAALTSILDDPSPIVRRALAMAFADSPDAPRHIVISLAEDQAEVSGLLIARSPLLTEADLIDLAVTGERLTLMALALRSDLTRRIAHAIGARQDFDSAFALVGNRDSDVAEADLLLIVEKFGEHSRMREVLLGRSDLPGTVRHALMLRVSHCLGGYVTGGGFLNPARNARFMTEATQSATVTIARSTGGALPRFVAHLRESGQLTPALLLRSVLGGETAFVATALAHLCEMDGTRITGIIASRSEAAISALVRRAGLPAFLHGVLTAAIRAAASLPASESKNELSVAIIHAAQSACIDLPGDEGVRLMALLRRFEAEAARASSRRIAESLRREVADERSQLSLLPLDIGPEMLRLAGISDDVAFEDGAAVPSAADEPATLIADGATVTARRIEAVLSRTVPVREQPRALGPVQDERIPSLKSLIAEWKAERAMLDRQQAGEVARFSNQNAKPGASRVA